MEYLTGCLMREKRFLTFSAISHLPWNLLPKNLKTPHLPSSNLPVQQHALNPRDVHFLPDSSKINELSRCGVFFVLCWFFVSLFWFRCCCCCCLLASWKVSYSTYCRCVHMMAEGRDEKTTANLLRWKISKIQSSKGRTWTSGTQAFTFTHHLESVALLHFPSAPLWSLVKRWWRDQSHNSARAGRFASGPLRLPCATLFDQVCPVHSSEKSAAI